MAKYELNISDYLRILRKRRSAVILVTVIVTLGSIFYVSSEPVVYQSSTTVKIVERKTVAGLLTDWILYSAGDELESETKTVKGYNVMRKTAIRMGMVAEASPLNKVNEAVSALQGSIETERIGATNMIRISTKADSPKRAMDLANTVAEVYIEENLAEKAKQVRHTRKFIEEQLGALEDRMRVTEEELRRFGEEDRTVMLADPIQKKLIDTQFALAEATQRYTEKHPRVIELRTQIKELSEQMKGLSSKQLEYARLVREVEVNRKLYALLKEKLEEARITEAQKVGDVSIIDPAFMPNMPVSSGKGMGIMVGLLMGLVLGVSSAFIFEALDTSIGTIDDVERVVKLRVLGLVPPLSKGITQKRKGLLGMIVERFMPSAAKKEAEASPIYLVAHYEPTSTAAEAYRNINTNLKLDPSRKTILVTSSGPGEGKTNVVSNLGIVMAQAGLKTLLVSADLRRPALDKAFGIKREPGLNEFVTGAVSFKDVLYNIVDVMVGEMSFDDIRKTHGLDNIWIIPSGRLSYNPAEILKSKEMSILIEKLKNRFDAIIFDVPPVLPVTDASILAPKMDAVVLVYEIGRTSREALIRAKIQLESAGAKIAGVVLNHTQPQTEAITTYPYYRYHYRYGEKEGEGKKGKVKETVA
ncbi:MAG: polysaccharide biosynthesis tyrosine autokinase [Candidatus Omnitrophica bacterium]|nr:polysaccharide biosynthesis tyrosine autokinase [Candidatus Omnitrophota bacterium]